MSFSGTQDTGTGDDTGLVSPCEHLRATLVPALTRGCKRVHKSTQGKPKSGQLAVERPPSP
eukprot:scaffold11673_cov100-Isochrysis_galbana.AAC.4